MDPEPSTGTTGFGRNYVVSFVAVILLILLALISPWTLSVVLIIFCGVFVSFEFALVKISMRELEKEASLGSADARLMLKMKLDLNAMLAACQFGITLTSLGLTLALEPAIHHVLVDLVAQNKATGSDSLNWLEGASVPIAMAIGAFLHVTFGELIPKGLALVVPHSVIHVTGPFMNLFRFLAVPFIKTCNSIANLAVRLVTGKDPDKDSHHEEEIELEDALDAAQTQGKLEPRQLSIIQNVLDFSERTAREVMTPARDVVSLDLQRSWEDNFRIAEEHGFSRFPVTGNSPHDVVGYIRRSELLKAELAGKRDLKGIIHPIERRPESAPLVLLNLFRGTPLIACFDEHDSFTGLLTAEDVIEQIVGEIYDETDDIEPNTVQVNADGSVRFDGATLLEMAARELHLDIDELPTDVDTIGGLVLKHLARQPARGDQVQIEDWEATVEASQGFRILSVIFKRKSKTDSSLDS